MVLFAIILGELIIALYFATSYFKLRGVMRSGLEKAERDRCYWVRIPANQVRDLGIVAREGFDRNPWDFTHTQQRVHPARLTPARRKKLGETRE